MSSQVHLPNVLEHMDEVERLASRGRLGLVLDFDGTISEIAPTPAQAVVHEAITPRLRSLAGKLPLMAVVSGRAASDIREKVGIDGIVYVGNHGAEYIRDGQTVREPGAGERRDKLKGVFDYLRQHVDVPGLVWEDKGLSIAIHYRQAPDPDQARRSLEAALQTAPGTRDLEIFWGKMVLEMRAPTGLNKGHAVRKLAADWKLAGLIFIGDDTTDVDGLLALREMKSSGQVTSLGIAVVHQDSPGAVLEASDYRLDGVAEVGSFLEKLEQLIGK